MDIDRLAKVLALAASDNDSEAVHALRTAHRLLCESGTDFITLSHQLARGGQAEALENAVFDLRNELRTLRAENERLRQGRFPTAPAMEPTVDARDAAELIRLRAEIDLARADAAEARALQAAQHEQYRLLLDEMTGLSARLGESEGKRLRLQTQNRRLVSANRTLTIDLAASRAQDVGGHDAITVAQPERGRRPRATAPNRSRSQYALF